MLVTDVTGSGDGLTLISSDLHSVIEHYVECYFRQLVLAIETTPTFLGDLRTLEDYGQRGFVR